MNYWALVLRAQPYPKFLKWYKTFKTVYMMLGSRQQLARAKQITLYIENEIIESADHQKLLGVIIDKNLSWDKQIDAVCANITRRITLLKLLSKYIDQPNMKLWNTDA